MEEQWQKYQNGSYDGLSDLKYTLHDFKANHLYSLIQANINGEIAVVQLNFTIYI